MLTFEKDVANLFLDYNIQYNFNSDSHLLSSETLDIQFVPNCLQEQTKSEQNDKVVIGGFKIILWEDVYKDRTAVVKSRILSLLGISTRIHGRTTLISTISQQEMDEFIIENHLNVTVPSKYRYGMFYQNQMVAVAAFGRSCPIQKDDITYKSHELIRFCSLLNYTVVGGLGKFIHHFEQEVKPEHIMTYVDREWSEGRGYKKLGFVIDSITTPQEFWLFPDTCERFYAKKLLQRKSISQLQSEGWQSIWNKGNIKLVKFIK